MTGSKEALFFIDQPDVVVAQFRQWLMGTTIECVVVEPLNRAFSLVVRDNPWGVVLNIETEIGEKLCAQIREDELLETVRVVALSTGASAQALTDHMFGDFSADVYGKLPLEDGIVDVWLQKQLSPSASTISSVDDSSTQAMVEVEAEIELIPAPTQSVPSTKRVPESTSDERFSRLELELFEQSEKLTTTNRSLLKARLQLQEVTAQNSMLQAECTRLQGVLSSGSSDVRLRQEVNRLYERLRIAEETIEQNQKQHVDVGLQAVETLSPQDLLREITILRSVRDEKVEQINALHGELQLTRQAVDTLQRRTEKAEARLTEVQNLGQLREQEMQREFVTLQRQVSNGTRNLEIAQHRERQLSQQIEQVTNRLQEMELLHQAEQANWLRKSEELFASTEKEAELLKEIDGLTAALQVQLMGDDGNDDVVESALIQSLEQRQESLQQALAHAQAKLSEVEDQNIQLKQQIAERTNQSGSVDSAQWKRQQQVLDSTLKALEDSLARQDELEQQLELVGQGAETSAHSDGDSTVATLRLENERLQGETAKLGQEMELLKRQHAVELEHLKSGRLAQASDSTDMTEAESVQRLSQSLEELDIQRVQLEGELSEARRTVQVLETERVRLQIALEDSQAMADAVEEATDIELAAQGRQVQELESSLREHMDAYQELETQTALVISERDEFWAQVEPLQEREKELETKLADLKQAQDAAEAKSKEQVEALTNALFSTEQELHNTQQTLKAKTTRIEELDQLVEELQVQAQEGLEVQQTLEALEAENKALSEQRQGLLDEVDALSEKQAATVEQLELAQMETTELTAQIAILEEEKREVLDEQSALTSELESQSAEIDRLQDLLAGQKAEIERLQSDLHSSQEALELSQAKQVSLQESIVDIQQAEQEARETSLNEQREALTRQHQAQMQELSEKHQNQKTEWQSRVDQLLLERDQQKERALLDENQRIVSLQLEIDGLKEQRVSLEQELKEGRDKVVDLEGRLESLEIENGQLRELEERLNQVNAERKTLERELETVRTEWSDAAASWDLERTLIEQEQEQEAAQTVVDDARVQTLESELVKIQQQRSELLDMIDDLTRAQEKSDARIQELEGPADDALLRVQQERDDALTELEMNALEIGIAQSAARQLAQQAERMRKEVLAQQEEWMRKLAEKESENARLRDTIDSMDKGLSSLFVKRPTF